MELIGRLDTDAVAGTIQEDLELVTFSITIYDRYRSGGEEKWLTSLVACSYQGKANLTHYLKKGVLVHLIGSAGINAYTYGDGHIMATFTFNAEKIRLPERGTTSGAAGNLCSVGVIQLSVSRNQIVNQIRPESNSIHSKINLL